MIPNAETMDTLYESFLQSGALIETPGWSGSNQKDTHRKDSQFIETDLYIYIHIYIYIYFFFFGGGGVGGGNGPLTYNSLKHRRLTCLLSAHINFLTWQGKRTPGQVMQEEASSTSRTDPEPTSTLPVGSYHTSFWSTLFLRWEPIFQKQGHRKSTNTMRTSKDLLLKLRVHTMAGCLCKTCTLPEQRSILRDRPSTEAPARAV